MRPYVKLRRPLAEVQVGYITSVVSGRFLGITLNNCKSAHCDRIFLRYGPTISLLHYVLTYLKGSGSGLFHGSDRPTLHPTPNRLVDDL